MGCFSWLKADDLTQVANIVEGAPFKLLIPQEFGGGFIKDYYQGYGYIGTKATGSPKYDMYELLAFWNAKSKAGRGIADCGIILEHLKYDGEFNPMKEIDEYTDDNRSYGISLDQDRAKYLLKLVSASYKGSYEDIPNHKYSRDDPNQGWTKLYRD